MFYISEALIGLITMPSGAEVSDGLLVLRMSRSTQCALVMKMILTKKKVNVLLRIINFALETITNFIKTRYCILK